MVAALAALMAVGASAQVNFWDEGTPEKSVTFGGRLGLNVANVSGLEGDWDARAGLRVGAAVDWHLINSLSINTGLYFTMKGGKTKYIMADEGYLYGAIYERVSYNALEIPVYLNYHFEVAPESQVQVFFGPYFDLGVYGRGLYKEIDGNDEYQESHNIFEGPDGLRRFSCGVGLGAAYTWHNCQISLQYQWACTNMAKDIHGGWNNFAITLGYNFSL